MATHNPHEEVLRKLETKSDAQAVRRNLSGRALSKSDKNLHLAVRSGVVAIPLANIERVIPRSVVHPDAVTVVVREPHDVRQLLQATPRPGSGGQTLARERIPIGTGHGPGVATCTYYTTTTISGDEEDACDDDGGAECQPDDLD
jgi:hypothetical protein